MTRKANLIKTSLAILLFSLPLILGAQTQDSLLQQASLDKVVEYALTHQPAVLQAQTDEEITRQIIRGKLADWYPQINLGLNYTHFYDVQTAVIQDRVTRLGVTHTSSSQFTATQTIFNRDVLLAASTASRVRVAASQNTSRSKINVVVNTTKAFYDVLATTQQIKVSEESVIRLERSLKDAQSRYNSGITDKTDYKRATILLRNAKASLIANQEQLKSKIEYLKALMGYPVEGTLPIVYDSLQMETEISLDTLQPLDYTMHIDYKILATQRALQESNVKYSYWAFLPSVSLNGAYNLNYQDDRFGGLYETVFPYSFIGGSITLPIFQGGKRLAKIKEQKWATKRIDMGMQDLKNNLNTEYTRAMASYKSNLANYLAQRENVVLAQEVYDIIDLQYRNGVKAYLDVTIAETDLRTTRINYFNALYAVLASKIDVQRALGQINY